MTAISSLLAVDPRSGWQKVSRRQCLQGATRLGLTFENGETQPKMVELFIANNITPEQVVKFVPVTVSTASGGNAVVMQPESQEPVFDEKKDQRRMELFEQRMEEAVKKEEARVNAQKDKLENEKNTEILDLKNQLSEMQDMMKKFMEQNTPVVEATNKPVDLHKMQWKKFQKLAKSVGMDWTTKDPREPVIEKLNAQ